MSSFRKRKHIALTIAKKLEIIKKLEKGENVASLCKEYGVGTSTIYDMKKRSDKLKTFEDTYKHNEKIKNTRKSTRFGLFPEVEDRLYNWFLEEQKKEAHITGDILREKATFFSKEIENQDKFNATEGWLSKFKKRFGIKLTSKKCPDDTTAIVKLCQDVERTLKEELEKEVIAITNDKVNNSDIHEALEEENTVTAPNKNDGEVLKAFEEERNIIVSNVHSITNSGEVKAFAEEKNVIIRSITHSEVVQAFDTCIKWAEQNNASVSDIFTLKRLGEKALTLSFESEIKKTFENFFPAT